LPAAGPGTRARSDALALGPSNRPEELPGGPLVASERRAIEAGKSLLRVLARQRVLLAHAPDPARSGRLIAADLDPDYLWTYDSNDPDSGLTVVDAGGQLVFSSLAEGPALGLIAASVPGMGVEHPTRPGADAPLAEPWVLFLASRFAAPTWYVVRSQSRELTFAPLAEFRAVFRWSLLLAVLVVAALSSIQIRRTLRPIQQLARAALRLGEGRLTRGSRSRRATSSGAGPDLRRDGGRIERHVQALASASAVGVALSHERSEERLVTLVLQAPRRHDEQRVRRVPASDRRWGVRRGGTLGAWTGVSPERAKPPQTGGVVLRPGSGPAARHRSPFRSSITSSDHGDPRGVAAARRARCAARGLPGIGSAAARSPARRRRVALNNRALVDEFRVLFEGLIGLTVTALDEKSAYTGGHCRRVPILAELLADAVCRTREGAFAQFEFSPAERYELRIAALLHDFGKVVTPVHVMDKSTKLETIHDRIELVAVATRCCSGRRRSPGSARARPGHAPAPPSLPSSRSCAKSSRSCDPATSAPKRWIPRSGGGFARSPRGVAGGTPTAPSCRS
jgi:hypothetical protein